MLRRAVIWSFTGQIVSFLVQFGSSIVIARLLSPRELGIFAVAMAVTGIAQLFSALGVANFVVREEVLTSDTLRTAFTINAILAAVLAVMIFALSFAGGILLHDDGVARVIRWLAVTPLLGIPAFSPAVLLQRAMQMRGVSIIAAVTTALISGVTILSAAAGASYMSPAYGAVCGAAFSAVATLAIGRRHLEMRPSLKRWRPIMAFGLRLMSIGGISNLSVRLSDIILARFLGLPALGLYSRATNLSNTLFTNVYGAATRVVFAKLSEAQRNGDRVTEVYLHGYRIITAVMAPILLGLAVLSAPAIHLLYGPRWAGVAVLLSLTLLAQLVTLTFAMNWELFVIRDELAVQTKLELLRSIWGVVTQTIGAQISLVAVAAINVLDALVAACAYQPHMARLARTTSSVFYRAYGEAAALACVAAAPPLALMLWWRWSPTTPMPLVMGSVAAGVLFWLTTITLTRHPILHEIRLAARLVTRSSARIAVLGLRARHATQPASSEQSVPRE